MAIITTRYNHMIEFLLLRSLPVAPFRLLFYACFSACFDEIQFSVFGLDYGYVTAYHYAVSLSHYCLSILCDCSAVGRAPPGAAAR